MRLREQSKAVAFTLIVAMMVVNFLIPRPAIPTLPHKSWHWLAPWPVQILETSGGTGSHVRVVRADGHETQLLIALIVATYVALLNNSMELLEELVRLAQERLLSPYGPNPGGGGGEICQACDF